MSDPAVGPRKSTDGGNLAFVLRDFRDTVLGTLDAMLLVCLFPVVWELSLRLLEALGAIGFSHEAVRPFLLEDFANGHASSEFIGWAAMIWFPALLLIGFARKHL